MFSFKNFYFYLTFWIGIFLFSNVSWPQSDGEKLLVSHSLTSTEGFSYGSMQNQGGEFSEKGWKASSEESQLTITLTDPLPFQGTFIIDVTNFDPVSQNNPPVYESETGEYEDKKQQIINHYRPVKLTTG